MANELDVVVIGSFGIDTNVYLYGEDIDFNVECNFSQNLDYVGQAGGYSSRGFAQLGYKTGCIAYLGDDHNGKLVKTKLKNDGIKGLFFTDPAGTKRSVNFMYKDGRRKNFFDGKSSMDVKPDTDLCRELMGGAKLAHFSIANWARYLLPLAKMMGITISTDLQDLVSLDDEYRKDFIKYADIIFFSAANFENPEPVIREIFKEDNKKIVICGMGSRGCAIGHGGSIDFFTPIEMEEPVIDTNGAGDALAVGFLSSYILDKTSFEEAGVKSQIAARHTCTQKASSDNLISKKKLQDYYQILKG